MRSSAFANAATISAFLTRSRTIFGFRYFGEQGLELCRRFGRYTVADTGRCQQTGFVQRRMRRTGIIDPHQRSVVQAHDKIS
jgi:hypothetical protein